MALIYFITRRSIFIPSRLHHFKSVDNSCAYYIGISIYVCTTRTRVSGGCVMWDFTWRPVYLLYLLCGRRRRRGSGNRVSYCGERRRRWGKKKNTDIYIIRNTYIPRIRRRGIKKKIARYHRRYDRYTYYIRRPIRGPGFIIIECNPRGRPTTYPSLWGYFRYAYAKTLYSATTLHRNILGPTHFTAVMMSVSSRI